MGKIKRILMVLISILLFAGAGFLVWRWWQSSHSGSVGNSSATSGDSVKPSDSSFSPSEDVLNGSEENVPDPSVWKIYKNKELGFSVNVPQEVVGVDKCKNSRFKVAITTFEDNQTGAVFVVPEYYFDQYTDSGTKITDPNEITFEEDDVPDTGDPNIFDSNGDGKNDCKKRVYSLALIKQEILGKNVKTSKIPLLGDPKAGIALRVAKIADTDHLYMFLQSTFGAGCTLAKKTAWSEQDGVYQLEIKKSGKTDEKGKELPCALDKVTDILYNPEKNKLVYASLSQTAKFVSDANGKELDRDMISSFRFN